MKISPARTAAFDILYRIETEKAFSSVLLPRYEDSLSPADAALCHTITLGSLRRQIWLDRVIDVLSGGKRLDAAVRVAVRMGLFQLAALDRVPDHPAINESVELVKRAKKTSAKGFVNAVLRRASREKIAPGPTDEIDRISVETSHPRWLIEKWIADLGLETASLLAAANNEVPLAAFRLTAAGRAAGVTDSTWYGSDLVDSCFLSKRITPEMRNLEREGAIYFQDEASQMIARAIGVSRGGSFLDVCAAPGGKTTIVAERFSGTMSLAVAGDLYHERSEHLLANCRRQVGNAVEVVQYDARRALPFADGSFDAVFVDAPCSGTGTIRHNPEIRYFLEPADLAVLSDKQLGILTNASNAVTQGGFLFYSTCSLEPEENEGVCRRFLAETSGFSICPPALAARFLTPDGFARTFPHRDGLDGFFMAVFQKG